MAKIGCLKPFRGSWNGMKDYVLEDGEIAFITEGSKMIYFGNGTDKVENLIPFADIGGVDISSIGSGSITSAINTINSKIKASVRFIPFQYTEQQPDVGRWLINYCIDNALVRIPVCSYGNITISSGNSMEGTVIGGLTSENFGSFIAYGYSDVFYEYILYVGSLKRYKINLTEG